MFDARDLHRLRQLLAEDYQQDLSLEEVEKIGTKLLNLYVAVYEEQQNKWKYDTKRISSQAS